MRRLVWIAALAALAGCSPGAEEPADDGILQIETEPNQDGRLGGLFHDFVKDGKYDAAGHPEGAEVFGGRERCAPTTGEVGDLGVAAQAGRDGQGLLCANETRSLGDGRFALNVSAAMFGATGQKNPEATDEPILEISVFDGDREVATRAVAAADFGSEGTDKDLAVAFTHRGDGAVRFEVRWTGAVTVRLGYVEIFRATPRLVVTPPSKVLDITGDDIFEIEMQDPPDRLSFAVECGETVLTERLADLLETGEATWTDTDFRTIVSVPMAALFDGCAPTSKVRVHALAGSFIHETSRVTYYAEPIGCDYASDGDVRVLLTGFEPFPADSDFDNSSKEAVEAYFAGEHPAGVSVMRAVLPVEYDAAPALMEDLIQRCEPDIIVGFGQGRSRVDLEQTAYNRKDSAAVAGGVPDNRGVVYGGAPIVEGAVPERSTLLPADLILAQLADLGINAGSSNDPGRYVCNNLFYTIIGATSPPHRIGGFVHLPRIPTVDDEDREMLRQTVAAVVENSVDVLGLQP